MTSTLDGPAAATAAPEPGRDASVVVEGVSLAYQPGVPVVDDVTLHVGSGRVVALLGPSGSGKTSLLRAVAGLERPSAGTITIGGRIVSGPRNWVRPEHRNVGMVFQDGALFPHLSVGANIAFGLRGTPRDEARRRIDSLLEMVDLAGYHDRLPGTLSGGQQQRVALARSLAPEPSVLLLDEPFSALDAALRIQVRSEVARILQDIGVTTIFVTHDQDEAFVLGDEVAVMRDGRIEQVGSPDDLYRLPATRWVAGFVGEANLLRGSVQAGGRVVETALGLVPLRAPQPAGTEVDVLIRPELLTLEHGESAVIEVVEYYGHDARYDVRLADGTALAVRATGEAVRARGEHVLVRFTGGPAEAFPLA